MVFRIRSYVIPVVMLAIALSPPLAQAGSDEPSFTKSRYPSNSVVDESFSLKAGGMLRVDVDDMDVYVKKTSGGTGRVQVFVSGPDEERSLEYWEEHMDFELGEKGNELTMTADGPRYHSGDFWKRYRNVHIWAVVEVPEKFDLDIATDDGDLRLDDITGNIRIRTEDGDVDTRNLGGPAIDIKSSDGDVYANTLKAKEEVLLDTSDGDINVDEITGARVSATTSDGNIRIESITGDEIHLRSSDGDIEVGASGGELSAACNDGDLQVRLDGAMSVDLRSRDGDIDIDVPESLDLDIELKGDNVSIRGGKLKSGRVSRSGASGTINKGGPLVRARSNDGTVALRLH